MALAAVVLLLTDGRSSGNREAVTVSSARTVGAALFSTYNIDGRTARMSAEELWAFAVRTRRVDPDVGEDAWGRAYRMRVMLGHAGKPVFEVVSAGANGEFGDEDDLTVRY